MAAFFRNNDSLFSSSAVAAEKLAQDSGIAAFFRNNNSLFSSSAVAAEKLAQDSGMAAFFRNNDSLFSSSAVAAEKLAQDSGMAAFFRNNDLLFSSSAVAAEKLAQDSGMAAFFRNNDLLFSSSTVAAEKLAQVSGLADLFRKQGSIFTDNYFATRVAKRLEKLDAIEIHKLHEAAILFSRSAHGAAVIATNIHEVEKKEPDALTKLKMHIEENPITSSFRKLPLLIQIIIIHLALTMHSIIDDKSKEILLDLIWQAQKYVSKEATPRTHLKELTRQLSSDVNPNSLRNIRIITGENVRLRNTPSMQGGVLVTLEKYTPVIVIDKSDKKWLYVQLSFEDQKISGWVNRSYTKAINH